MKNDKSLKQNIKYYFLIIFGFGFVSWYLYITFIRERLPRDIPFILTEFRFYILLGVCCVYIFAIKSYIFPKPLNPIFIPLIQTIAKPLVYFDNFIKTNKYVLPYYFKFFRYITFILDNNFTFKDRVHYIWSFYYIPRLLLLLIFILDVFYFQQIKFFYFLISINLIPLLYNYTFKYSLEVMYNEFRKHLENKYDDVYVYVVNFFTLRDDINYEELKPKYHETEMKIEEYIQMKYETKFNIETEDLKYMCEASAKGKTMLEYKKKYDKINLTSEDFEIIDKEFHFIMPSLLELYEFITLNKGTLALAYFKKCNLILFMGYLCCWSYILFKSFHTLQDFSLTMEYIELFLKNINNENPFID